MFAYPGEIQMDTCIQRLDRIPAGSLPVNIRADVHASGSSLLKPFGSIMRKSCSLGDGPFCEWGFRRWGSDREGGDGSHDEGGEGGVKHDVQFFRSSKLIFEEDMVTRILQSESSEGRIKRL
jgi:hypothetical protein